MYGPELFPTSLRGRANGVIAVLGVVGTVIGLVVAGVLSDRWDGLGPALAVLSVGPLIVGVLVLVAYPETAHHELEELNPEDPVLLDLARQPSAATHPLTASARAASAPLRSWPLPSIHTWVDRAGDRRRVVLQLRRRAERVPRAARRTGTGTSSCGQVLDAELLRLARRVQRIG